MSSRSYTEALERLSRALKSGINPSLAGIAELVSYLGDPHDRFVSVQVAGTNGKTSTARLTEAVLRGQGLRTALYTSPELERPAERLEIAGRVVSDDVFAEAVWAALEAAEALRPGTLGTAEGFTEFELVTAGALWAFAREDIDVAVLEVGMGGRWDATSVVAPAVAVITGIGMDHAEFLGDTLEKIAAEKAAIIKPASAPILGPYTAGLEHAFLEQARAVATHARAVRACAEPSPVADELTVRYEVSSASHGVGEVTRFDCFGVHGRYTQLSLPLPSYQAANACVAIAAAEALVGRELHGEALRRALAHISIPGRFEVVHQQPLVIADGSHNPQAAWVLADAVREMLGDVKPTVLLGMLSDKDAGGIVEQLAAVAGEFAVVGLDHPRALGVSELEAVVAHATGTRPRAFDSVSQALDVLIAENHGAVLATGSLRTVAETKTALRGIPKHGNG